MPFYFILNSQCNKKASGWSTRLLQNEANPCLQTLLGRVFCSFPDYAHAKSTFGLAERSAADSTVSNTLTFILLDLFLAVFFRLSEVTNRTVALSRSHAVYLSSSSAAPVFVSWRVLLT